MTAKTVVADVALLGKMAGYIETLVRDPQSPAFVPLCEIYLQFNLLDEALDVARRGTVALPAYAPGFSALGRALVEQSHPDEAQEAFRTALALDADQVPALVGLARIALSRGEYRPAVDFLQSARRVEPANEVAAQLLNVAQKLASVSIIPPSPEVAAAPEPGPVLPLPVLDASATDDDGELEELDDADVAEIAPLAAGTAPIATATIADIYIRQGFPEKALKVYADLLLTEPDNRELRERHDRLAITLGREVSSMAAEVADATADAASPADVDAALIAVYERWLAAIEQRRAHVQ